MKRTLTTRRLTGSVAATAVGLGVITNPAAASAQDITIDLGAVAEAAQDLQTASESPSGITANDLVSGAAGIAAAINVSQADGPGAPSAPSSPSTPTSAYSDSPSSANQTSPSAAETATDYRSVTPTESEATIERDEVDEENEALAIANDRPANIGQTADGRTVVFPTTGRFTSGFGPRWGRFHYGIDIANPIGTPIRAVMDGTVIATGPASGFGNWVVIKHDGGEKSVYGHMAQWDVSVGQRVEAGQVIAYIGNEGRSTGPHLHFEIRPDGTTAVDPVPWFKQQGISMEAALQA
ncbi:M23 family metallopeptidase [Corynebacterium uterequi]|uniref:Metalloendopeptidase-like membrane protein n=1 Tax=Corynebacterium uterequi TaxID=1072256 RepID=A0A0G3HFI5_9CORY|nr:M23 family metallopeptidase [Corynebacterium uterequi]AKK10683.1 metalloendopeptidase-like membrane protein [Corynebacterium uterequi]